jgi:hypothetical protein
MDVRTFVSLDTETGIVRRYSETARPTHVGGLTNDPEDGTTTSEVIQEFRLVPPWRLTVPNPRLRTFEDALIEQRARQTQQLLIADQSHRDEA